MFGTLNDNPNIPAFVMRYAGTFRVGVADRFKARDFAQVSVMANNAYYPWFMMIDKKGVVRAQHFGGSPFFGDELRNIKELALRLLAEPSAPAAAKAPLTPKKKK